MAPYSGAFPEQFDGAARKPAGTAVGLFPGEIYHTHALVRRRHTMKGTVKFFNTKKGFGFVSGEDGTDYFVHQTGVQAGVTLQENDTVTFDVEQGERGPKAVRVGKE